MFITKTRTALTVLAASLSVAAIASPAAMATDNAPTLPANGCIVSIDGHDHVVPAGTVVMGLVCGTDGDWHFAPRSVSPTKTPQAQVGVIQPTAASAYRSA